MLFPSWPVNCWIGAMFRLVRPQMTRLLRERDAAIEAWSHDHRKGCVFEDRALEITGWLTISVSAQDSAVRTVLASPDGIGTLRRRDDRGRTEGSLVGHRSRAEDARESRSAAASIVVGLPHAANCAV